MYKSILDAYLVPHHIPFPHPSHRQSAAWPLRLEAYPCTSAPSRRSASREKRSLAAVADRHGTGAPELKLDPLLQMSVTTALASSRSAWTRQSLPKIDPLLPSSGAMEGLRPVADLAENSWGGEATK